MKTSLNYKDYLEKGISYMAYSEQLANDLMTQTDPQLKNYIFLNQHRMKRVEKTYQVSDQLAHIINGLSEPIHWLVITEHWCGDASQSLPILGKIAQLSDGKINLKFVYRDENPELMDAYLTNKGRAIPKLIQLNSRLAVTATWGPRPKIAQELVKELKSNPATASDYATTLQLWYAKDKQVQIEMELAELLIKTMAMSNKELI